MNEETIDACIKELVQIRRGLNLLADQKIMNTGKGDFFMDGQVNGLNIAIAALEDFKLGEGDV